MKSLAQLWEHVYASCVRKCSAITAAERDLATFHSRLDAEGLQFLCITLPTFGVDFDRSLAEASVSTRFAGWAKRERLPRFLGGFVRHVFETDGSLLGDPCLTCIASIRQLTMLFGKMSATVPQERVQAAFDTFVRTDLEVPDLNISMASPLRRTFERVFGSYLHTVENSLDSLVPRHGSGACAERRGPNERYAVSEWSARLSQAFPYWYFAVASPLQLQDADILVRPGYDERPVRVVTVPKTLKAPRIIAIEPSYMQFMQQGILRVMTDSLEHHRRVDQTLGWMSQEPNRQLALLGSTDGGWATLDLSEASDRVPAQLVYHLLGRWPVLRRAIFSSRSRYAELPDGRKIRLRKFASMGSAMCFPIESMVFSAIAIDALRIAGHRTKGTTVPFDVRVFGDDIIVPSHVAAAVSTHLEAFGLKVNTNKSFYEGLFRESCGVDAYQGHDVTPVRVRRSLSGKRNSPEELLSTLALRNHLYEAGMFEACEWLDDRYLSWVPAVPPNSELTGRWLSYDHRRRYNAKLQRMEYREIFAKPVKRDDPIDGYTALLKWFCVGSSDDKESYQKAGRPVASSINYRWSV